MVGAAQAIAIHNKGIASRYKIGLRFETYR